METATIKRDARVFVEDGELGRVKHVVIDPRTREVTHLVIRRDGDDRLIPTSRIVAIDGQVVRLEGDRARYYSASLFDREQFRPVDEDVARDESQGASLHGGAPLIDAEEDAVEIGGTGDVQRYDRYDAGTEPTPPPAVPAEADGSYHLQLKEERLNVTTEPVQVGAVRVSKRIAERLETVTVPVREERLIVEVMPGSGRVRIGERELQEGETLEVLLFEERAVAGKEVVISEDVVVRKDVVERQEEVRETVRREELVVDQDDDLIVEDEEQEGERAYAPTASPIVEPTMRMRRPEGIG